MTVVEQRARTAAASPVAKRRLRRFRGRLLGNEVMRFTAGGLLAALLVGAGTFVVVGRDAEAQAVNHAKDVTQVEARGVVEPALTDPLLHHDPVALAQMDSLVHRLVLGGAVVRVKLWTGDGTIVYSDEHALVGRRFVLESAELASLRTGTPDAGVSDLTDAENVYERGFGKLLQVYLRVRTPDGVPLLFETYQFYSAITQYQQQVWASFLPVLLGGLGILFVVQVPLAVGLARRLRASVAEREALLERAINASEQERRRIARDLHDGVVQRLAAVTFSLSALARRLAPGGAAGNGAAGDVEHASGETRAAMRDLRSLIVEIAPPNLHAEGIDNALRDLLEPLSQRGIAVSLEAPSSTGLPSATTTLLFRVAQEALRNAAKHADAQHVGVVLDTSATHRVRLEVRDDGRGFSADDLERRRRAGHVGLSLLRDLVADAGGTLHVESGSAQGTVVTVDVPR